MTTISISPWTDPIIDTLGHDPRSEYVERFWLPTLGPTSLLLLRRIATHFDDTTEDLVFEVADLSQSLGLGAREGASSPLFRSLDRLVQFDLACSPTPGAYAVRRTVPPINRRHTHRLPLSLQRDHDTWIEEQLTETPVEHARRRARRVAFTLFEQGDDLDHVERTLLGIGFHPTICRESAQWAYDRHRAALDAVEAMNAPGASSVDPPDSPAADTAA